MSSSQEDHLTLRRLFAHTNWVLLQSTTCLEALALLQTNQIPVVMCDCNLPDGNWKDILHHTAVLNNPPQMIVASRLADDHLWAEVLNLGGYNVLEKPFDRTELFRVVSLAWLHWKNQCENKNRRMVLAAGASSFSAAI